MSNQNRRNDSGQHTIRTRDLTKTYGETEAVTNLNLAVPNGVVYGFLGPNGAGKTTTMRMLTGLVTPTSGSATVAGVSISEPNELVEQFGYAPADPPLYELLTGREKLTYAGRFRDMDPNVAADRIEALLERFDLSEAADDRIETYSGGMKMKTGIAQAVLHDPEVLILDEPTSGLDPGSVSELRNLLQSRVADGRTVFLSTHVLSVINAIADIVGILNDGRLVAEQTPEELKTDIDADGDPSLEDAFIAATRSDGVAKR